MKFFNRLIQDSHNRAIVEKLSVFVHDHFVVEFHDTINDVGYYDVRDFVFETMEDSKLLNSLLPQQRKPFLNGLTQYCYNSIFQA